MNRAQLVFHAMLDDAGIKLAVAEALADLGASVEVPGYVKVPVDNCYDYCFGNANGDWAGDIIDVDTLGLIDDYEMLPSNLPKECKDVKAIVDWIRAVIADPYPQNT